MKSEHLLIEINGLSKSFPGVKALDEVDFNLRAGEVHAVLGENGAGKSTLMKVIGGIHQRDSGEYRVLGHPVVGLDPKKAEALGISIIHQELNLCSHLSVAENIFLGRESTRFGGVIAQREMNIKAEEILNRLKIDISPTTLVSELPVSKQQMVEIAKALSINSQILIMDEPTSALTETEIDELFTIVRGLRDSGCGIVYISHRLEELESIADRVSIYRDGRYIVSMDYKNTNLDEIIAYMVGRKIWEKFPRIKADRGNKILEVQGLNCGIVKQVNFELFEGEILGIAGLMGAGRTELVRAIFGADKIESGRILLDGKEIEIKSPRSAIAQGIVLGPEDRKSAGLCTKLSIRENIALANLDKVTNRIGIINSKREKILVQEAIHRLGIKTPSIEQLTLNLSGGNQQKVVIAKWLARKARVVIFDEPTRGIDVAAKVSIYKIMNQLKEEGVGVLFVSSEMPEVLGMSDRIIVMCNGRITGELDGRDAVADQVLHFATKYKSA